MGGVAFPGFAWFDLSLQLCGIMYKCVAATSPIRPTPQEDADQHRQWSYSVLAGLGPLIKGSVSDAQDLSKVWANSTSYCL